MKIIAKKILLIFKNWIVPPSIWLFISRFTRYILTSKTKQSESVVDKLSQQMETNQLVNVLEEQEINASVENILSSNKKFFNLHKGERLFILCTGPSIKEENLSLLKNEICMGVSNFYKHEKYEEILPMYHATPNVFYDNMREEQNNPDPQKATRDWFEEMDRKTFNASLFFGSLQEPLVRENMLFKGRNVNYLKMDHPDFNPTEDSIDITKAISGVQSVPIMCLMLGLYMGFKTIYLLGVDHDSLWSQRYDHFYNYKDTVMKTGYYDEKGEMNLGRFSLIESSYNLWQQYIHIHEIAKKREVSLINLSNGSYLDILPKKRLSEIL